MTTHDATTSSLLVLNGFTMHHLTTMLTSQPEISQLHSLSSHQISALSLEKQTNSMYSSSLEHMILPPLAVLHHWPQTIYKELPTTTAGYEHVHSKLCRVVHA
jgi:hypothetical protein